MVNVDRVRGKSVNLFLIVEKIYEEDISGGFCIVCKFYGGIS